MKYIRYILYGLVPYLIINKIEKKSSQPKDMNKMDPHTKIPRGGENTKILLALKNFVTKDRAVKAALITLFGGVIIKEFQDELKSTILGATYAALLKVKEAQGVDKVLEIMEITNPNEIPNSIKGLVLDQILTNEDKINFFKIKIDYIFNGDHNLKGKFLVGFLLAIITGVLFSGTAGLAIFLEALRRLELPN